MNKFTNPDTVPYQSLWGKRVVQQKVSISNPSVELDIAIYYFFCTEVKLSLKLNFYMHRVNFVVGMRQNLLVFN